MKALELADAMEIRASIRKKATNRKSVQENANDRLADQLTQAATMLRQQQAEIEALKKKTQYWLHTLHCTCGNHWEISTYPPVLIIKEGKI